jgi:signal recognition particle GTPase
VNGEPTLDDYARILRWCERRFPQLLPHMPGIDPFHGHAGYSAVPQVLGIIEAMTSVERAAPDSLVPARRAEVAASAGVAAWEVGQLLAEFAEWREGARRVAAMSWWQRVRLVLGWGRPRA